MNYNEELDEYISNFFNKLSESFELAPTSTFAKYLEEKTITQFGYKNNIIQTVYEGERRHLKEFPFKWGFNNEFTVLNTNGPDEYYVASPKMETIVQKTIDEQEAFFNSIVASLLLQDYFAVLETNPEYRVQRLVPLPATRANSSMFGSIDYIEYIFHLVLYKDNP